MVQEMCEYLGGVFLYGNNTHYVYLINICNYKQNMEKIQQCKFYYNNFNSNFTN